MTDLLDEVTKLLAYVGDEGAKDGYYVRENNAGNAVYSTPIRPEPLEDEALEDLVNQVKMFLESDTSLDNVPKDIVNKVNNLKNAFNESTDEEKAEVIEYLSMYEVNPMHGGRRKRNNRKSKRTVKKRRNNRKTRRNNRK